MEHETLPARRKTIFRDLAAAILAVPVLASTVVASLARRFRLLAFAFAIALVGLGGAGVLAMAGGGLAPTAAADSPTPAPSPTASAMALTGFVEQPTAAPAAAVIEPAPSAAPTAVTSTVVVSGSDGSGTASPTPPAAPTASASPDPTPKPASPKVVRFRPRDRSTGIATNAEVSVRFTAPMYHAPTAKAFVIRVNGKVVKGTVKWAERSTVLIVAPAKPFPLGAKVTLTVGTGARSVDGGFLKKRVVASFTVAKKKPTTSTKITVPTASSTWYSAELYMLKLLNCTRTGGWVQADGTCTGAGSRNVAPLKLDAGISDRVSRPYARLIATTAQCSHYADGSPPQRLARAGYTNWDWAENVGCPEISPIAGMLAVQRFFQSEKPYNGGHYRNLMNAAYDRVGIGVWVSNGHCRVVIDFYHP